MESPYARCLEISRRVRWEIGRHVIRGRSLDFSLPFLPESLTRLSRLGFLTLDERRFMSQVQGRTYAGMFAFLERFIGVKLVQLAASYHLDDPKAFEALVRFADDEIKHQELFRRLEEMADEGMPPGYVFAVNPELGANAVLEASDWSVLALTCHIELFTQSHYLDSMDEGEPLSPVFRDAFRYHWREEAQHAVADEIEWRREDARLAPAERERAIGELIGLLRMLDGVLRRQARADAAYFLAQCPRRLDVAQECRLVGETREAYRWQFIRSGMSGARFRSILESLITPAQVARVDAMIESLPGEATPHRPAPD